MTQQEAYKILGITEEEIEAAGAVPEGTEAAGVSTETSQSFDNAFQNFNRQAVERLIKKKYRQRILSAHPDVQPEEETEYSAQQLNYAYAYLKKNGWYDGHVSKKSYQVKSHASKTQVWDAPVNLRAWREREIYSYAEDSEGEKIGYFKIAAGKYIWKTEEDFSLFQKSIFACASQILEEVERKKQIYKSERLRIQTLAALVYLLAQHGAVKRAWTGAESGRRRQPDFSDSGDAGADRKHPGSRGRSDLPEAPDQTPPLCKKQPGRRTGLPFVSGRLHVLCCHPADGTTPCKGSHESC